MKIAASRFALTGGLLAVMCAVTTTAIAAEGTPLSPQGIQAKILYCKTCHGLSGQGFRGATAIPRLAGQPVEYFESQVHAFDERRRTNPIMFNVAHVLSADTLSAISKHFHDLNPKPLGGAPRDTSAAGKKIFDEGVPGKDVPACASCHGPQAKGDGVFPRLAGQLHDYIFNKLTNWTKERGQDAKNPDNSAIMQPIAHGLTEPQVRAVAAYLSQLE
jgi:cytochrome c553